MTRRTLLAGTGLTALLPLGSAARGAAPDPFTLGVASGDPAPGGVVLWTRLAVRPLAEDGLGGMSGTADVAWQLAEDEGFGRVVRSGVAQARSSGGYAVHVEVDGLQPGREYFYRFRSGGHLSPAGRTRTSPAAGSLSPLVFASASCSHYEHGYFTAYRRLAEQDPDLVVHLGDYMYEYAPGDYRGSKGGPVRKHTAGKLQTLTDYRRRHAQYKNDPDLRAAHAAAPWAVVWDDHELENNWAGATPGSQVPGFADRKRNAMRAYYENMPLRRSSVPSGTKIQLYRRLTWGALATFHLLDTRQYRSDQACDDGLRTDCKPRSSSQRTLLGGGQMQWLAAGLKGGARWDVLAQQIFLGQRDFALGPVQELSMDAWDGYAAERNRLFAAISASGARNPVALTGDVHTAFAGDLLRDFADPDSARMGVELVATSIASDGDGYDDPVARAATLAENPHLVHTGQRRGFTLARVSASALTAEFHSLPYISRKGAPSKIDGRFTVQDGARSFALS